jgi:hypothetical protein
MLRKEKEYLSLKEASELTGYSSDYVGQLIRSGKIEGKQVYSHVSWVTTKDALDAYMNKNGKVPRTPVKYTGDPYARATRLFSVMTKTVLAVSLCLVLFLGYVLAVAVDRSIEARAIERMEYARN